MRAACVFMCVCCVEDWCWSAALLCGHTHRCRPSPCGWWPLTFGLLHIFLFVSHALSEAETNFFFFLKNWIMFSASSLALLFESSATTQYVSVLTVLPHGPVQTPGSSLFPLKEPCRIVTVLIRWREPGQRAWISTFFYHWSHDPQTWVFGSSVVEALNSRDNKVMWAVFYFSKVTIWDIVQGVYNIISYLFSTK